VWESYGIIAGVLDTLHAVAKPVVNLGLIEGSTATIDIFYCERQSTGSDIEVTSNIISAPPTSISMTVNPDTDVVPAGTNIVYTAHVKKSDGSECTVCNQNVTWYLYTDPLNPTSQSYLTPPSGSKGQIDTFHAVTAYTRYIISAVFDSTPPGVGVDKIHLTWFDTVTVVPGPATHLNIEQSPVQAAHLWGDNYFPQHSLTIPGTVQTENVYAVLRDAYGNWVGHATVAQWNSTVPAAASVAPSNAQVRDTGVITRQAPSGFTKVSATQGAFRDTLNVTVSNVQYGKIQIYIISGGLKPIDSLFMRTDQDTTLHVRAQWVTDTSHWDENLPFQWASSSTVTGTPPTGSIWNFIPQAPGTGIIYVNYTSNGKILGDTVKFVFVPGLPSQEKLYPLPGTPNTVTPANQQLPASVTIVAGVPFQIVAKLFDNKNQWLSSYERTNAPIAWSQQPLSGTGLPGTLSATTGYLTKFTDMKAGDVIKITAAYVQEPGNPNIVPPQSITISVIAGPATHLVIEQDSARSRSPNADNPAGTVNIGARDTSAVVYAILRDAYGNWVDYSKTTAWSSADVTKAIAVPRNTDIGQGILIRRTTNGQTVVTARDTTHTGAGFTGTVTVILSNISYDSLRIVVGSSNLQIQNLVMRTDVVRDTTLNVVGKNSATGTWDLIPANWSIVPALKTSAPPPQAISWQFTPIDTGTGIIVVSRQGSVPDTLAVHFLPGLANSLVLYTGPGAPGGANVAFIPPATALIDTAGKLVHFYAKIFDKNGVWLGSYERAGAPVAWNIAELTGNPPTGTLDNARGYTSALTPTRAYNTLYVIARLDSAGLPTNARDTVQIQVVHAAPSQLVLEADPNWQVKANAAAPVDSVRIANNQTTVPVYALVRDRFGNFVQYSTFTDWESIDNSGVPDSSIVSVHNGTNTIGEGIVKRIAAEGSQRVYAASREFPGLADTIKAIVLKYYYKELRIVVRSAVRIDSLTMSTNNDTTLQVQGLRSDTTLWEPVNANWEISAGLQFPTNQAPPGSADRWFFSPSAPGTGWIRVTLGNDAVTKPDTIQAIFTVGEPILIETEILTPASQRIAGDTIIAVTRIKNKDGLVPGQWCDSTTYLNALGSGGGGRPNPTVDMVNMGRTMYECFQDGLDTVKYVLYYAPVNPDSLDKVAVTMRVGPNVLSASSEPFRVYPGALARISLEDFNGKNLDSIYLVSPTGSKLIIAVGYDAYGNYRGPEISNWSMDGTLHAIDKPTGATRVFYETGQVKYGEDGYIRASATGKGGAVVTDSTRVVISGSAVTLLSAVTHDTSGNGLLDEITLVFDRKVTLPAGTRIQLSNGSYTLVVSSIRGQTSGTSAAVDGTTGLSQGAVGPDSVFTVVLSESNKTVPQTGWKPALTITGASGMAPVNGYTVTDGAGPVIWSIVKTVGATTDRSQDKVTVTFSEPVGTNGNEFTKAMPPSGIFRVWEMHVSLSGDTTYSEVPGMLTGITEFFQVENNGLSVSFYMSNDKDLTTRHYLNIVFDSTGRITDKDPPLVNAPVLDNRRVQVTVKSEPAREILVVPNPSAPTFVRQRPGELHLEHQPNARGWVRQDGAGTVMTFRIAPATGEKVTGYLKIYDVVGNVVSSVDSSKSPGGIVPPSWASSDSSAYDYDIYWNGSNSQGSKVAAGVYRAMLFLKYTDQAGKARNTKLMGTVGISR
jgi:hypothetical protein